MPKCAREKCHYAIIRNDLPPGFAAAMILHAAGETGPAPDGTIAVVLGCRDQDELLALAKLDPEAHLIHECEGPFGGQVCAIGFPPCPDKKRHYRHLKLWTGGDLISKP